MARATVTSADRMAVYASTIAFQWLAAGVTAWRALARGMDAALLGMSLRDPVYAVAAGGAMALALGLLQFASLRQLSRIPVARRGRLQQIASRLMPQDLKETLPFVAVVCTVSVCEEFLYRGFAFGLFWRLSGNSLFAAVVGSSALFAVGHLYQGWRGVASTFVVGLLFAGARAQSGSLVPSIMAHLVVDLMAGFGGRWFSGVRTTAEPETSTAESK
jgi:membrane protease YdiL (CAAX protease family)